MSNVQPFPDENPTTPRPCVSGQLISFALVVASLCERAEQDSDDPSLREYVTRIRAIASEVLR